MDKKIKLIAIDLDGTLFNDDKEISQSNRDALQLAVDQGIRVVICTGRTLQGVQEMLHQLPIPPQAGEEFIILNNGTSIYGLPNLDLLVQHWLADELKTQILAYSQRFIDSGIQLAGFDAEHFYLVGDQAPNDGTLHESYALRMPVTPLNEQGFISKGLFKVVYLGDPDLLDEFVQKMPTELREAGQWIRSFDFLLECLPSQINKGYALRELAQYLKVKPADIMAIGDERNDLDMLEYAGVKVAMGNAHPELKAIANEITDTNNQSGVAQIIHKYLTIVNE